MKELIVILIALCNFLSSSSQNPLVKIWDKRYGGIANEFLTGVQQTSDRGFILAGYSYSAIGGDKTQNTWGLYDYWIVKIDSVGNKLWDKDFGASRSEGVACVQQTSDSGFIIGGFSDSDISGDKTQNNWDTTLNSFDYWLVKTDASGNKQWDKVLGGTAQESLHSIHQTTDGGYIIGGWSSSDSSGDKTQNIWDINPSGDYWIVKINSIGNKQWDKNFGGFYLDWLSCMELTQDGGYILGGYSSSGISGDKTQNNWGAPGTYDYWIVKVDAQGNKQWDKDFGGTLDDRLLSIQQSSDGGYILGGSSYSNSGGDKTQMNWDTSGQTSDYWIIKIDSLGNKQWDKVFGGTGNDYMNYNSISPTSDAGYLLSGGSQSPVSGDKTEANMGLAQGWIIKIDSTGIKQWDKTIFTNGTDDSGKALDLQNGYYAVASATKGGIGGYKTQPNWDTTNYNHDYWIVIFRDTNFIQSNLTAITNVCPETCIDFINLSLNATSYQWNFPGAVPDTSTAINPTNICYNTPGSYSVTLIASNANGSDTLTLQNYITVYPSPPPQSITQIGDTLFAVAGAPLYQWYFNGNIISGATNYFYIATASGDYNMIATDTNGCEVEAVINNVLASAQFANSSWRLAIFPNPVNDKFTIQELQVTSGTAEAEISVYNMMGEKMNVAADCCPWTVDCRQLNSGMYYIEMNANNKIFRSKFLKQ